MTKIQILDVQAIAVASHANCLSLDAARLFSHFQEQISEAYCQKRKLLRKIRSPIPYRAGHDFGKSLNLDLPKGFVQYGRYQERLVLQWAIRLDLLIGGKPLTEVGLSDRGTFGYRVSPDVQLGELLICD